MCDVSTDLGDTHIVSYKRWISSLLGIAGHYLPSTKSLNKSPDSSKMLFKSITLATLASAAVAQSPAYGQCGGQGWSGSKTCVSGYTCQAQGSYYSQCVPGSGKSSPTFLPEFTDEFIRRKQPNHQNHHQNHFQSLLTHLSLQRRLLQRRRQNLLSIFHAVRFHRHLGQRQLPSQVHSLRFLHARLQRRHLPERIRRRSCKPSSSPNLRPQDLTPKNHIKD
jgi:hypothetical protein